MDKGAGQYQGGFLCVLFTAQGAKPLESIKFNGSVKKDYDKDSKSQVLVLEPSTTGTKVSLPKDGESMALSHRILVVQLFANPTSPISIELNVTDSEGRRRMHFSSSFNSVVVDPLHVKYPLCGLPRNTWLQLCLDVQSIYDTTFRGLSFLNCITSVSIAAQGKLRKIFTMQGWDDGHSNVAGPEHATAIIPSTVGFPRNVECVTVPILSGSDLAMPTTAPTKVRKGAEKDREGPGKVSAAPRGSAPPSRGTPRFSMTPIRSPGGRIVQRPESSERGYFSFDKPSPMSGDPARSPADGVPSPERFATMTSRGGVDFPPSRGVLGQSRPGSEGYGAQRMLLQSAESNYTSSPAQGSRPNSRLATQQETLSDHPPASLMSTLPPNHSPNPALGGSQHRTSPEQLDPRSTFRRVDPMSSASVSRPTSSMQERVPNPPLVQPMNQAGTREEEDAVEAPIPPMIDAFRVPEEAPRPTSAEQIATARAGLVNDNTTYASPSPDIQTMHTWGSAPSGRTSISMERAKPSETGAPTVAELTSLLSSVSEVNESRRSRGLTSQGGLMPVESAVNDDRGETLTSPPKSTTETGGAARPSTSASMRRSLAQPSPMTAKDLNISGVTPVSDRPSTSADGVGDVFSPPEAEHLRPMVPPSPAARYKEITAKHQNRGRYDDVSTSTDSSVASAGRLLGSQTQVSQSFSRRSRTDASEWAYRFGVDANGTGEGDQKVRDLGPSEHQQRGKWEQSSQQRQSLLSTEGLPQRYQGIYPEDDEAGVVEEEDLLATFMDEAKGSRPVGLGLIEEDPEEEAQWVGGPGGSRSTAPAAGASQAGRETVAVAVTDPTVRHFNTGSAGPSHRPMNDRFHAPAVLQGPQPISSAQIAAAGTDYRYPGRAGQTAMPAVAATRMDAPYSCQRTFPEESWASDDEGLHSQYILNDSAARELTFTESRIGQSPTHPTPAPPSGTAVTGTVAAGNRPVTEMSNRDRPAYQSLPRGRTAPTVADEGTRLPPAPDGFVFDAMLGCYYDATTGRYISREEYKALKGAW
jgi:hypothetical protein